MTMSVTQVRLPKGLVNEMNRLVNMEIYTNKSDVVRDALRRLILDNMIGILPDKKNSVKEIRNIRKKLSKENFDLNKINKLVK